MTETTNEGLVDKAKKWAFNEVAEMTKKGPSGYAKDNKGKLVFLGSFLLVDLTVGGVITAAIAGSAVGAYDMANGDANKKKNKYTDRLKRQ